MSTSGSLELSLKSGDSKTLSLKSGDSKILSLKSGILSFEDKENDKEKEGETLSLRSFEKENNIIMILLSIVMTRKMMRDEKSNGNGFWPKNAIVKGKNTFRTIQLSSDNKNNCSDWLDTYGCMWEEI